MQHLIKKREKKSTIIIIFWSGRMKFVRGNLLKCKLKRCNPTKMEHLQKKECHHHWDVVHNVQNPPSNFMLYHHHYGHVHNPYNPLNFASNFLSFHIYVSLPKLRQQYHIHGFLNQCRFSYLQYSSP